jgi:hypothetical protein
MSAEVNSFGFGPQPFTQEVIFRSTDQGPLLGRAASRTKLVERPSASVGALTLAQSNLLPRQWTSVSHVPCAVVENPRPGQSSYRLARARAQQASNAPRRRGCLKVLSESWGSVASNVRLAKHSIIDSRRRSSFGLTMFGGCSSSARGA